MERKLVFSLGMGVALALLSIILALLLRGAPNPGPVAQTIAPTLLNARCEGTRLNFDIANPNNIGVNASVDYGGSWTGWGDFWVPPQTTFHFVVDQGVSCANALPLTIQAWGTAAECPWPSESTRWRCGR